MTFEDQTFEDRAFAAFRRGETEAVARGSERELARARAEGDVAGQVGALSMVARVAVRGGELRRAEELAAEGLALARDAGDRDLERSPVHILAGVARMAGDLAAARAGYRESIALRRELGLDEAVVWEQLNLGAVEVKAGHRERAGELFEVVERYGVEHGCQDLLMYVTLARAVLVADEDPLSAARLLGQAEATVRARGEVFDPDDAAEADALREQLVRSLGTAKFEEQYAS